MTAIGVQQRTRPARRGGRLRAAAFGVLLLSAGPAQSPASAQPPADPLRGLDTYITSAVADWGIAGLSIAVVKDDRVVFAKGYGVRETGRPDPVTPATLFAIGSNTKLFTAVAAGLMVDAAKLSWDDPATKHLPGFQLFDPYVTREIRIRDLLSHRSGLGRRGDMVWYGTPLDRADVLRRVRHLEPNSSFRSEFGYQNIMFLAAGEAVARVAGMRWDEVIDRRIFEALGMRRSNTSVGDLAGEADVATPHTWSDGHARPIAWRNIDNIAPAGSINSSAEEMAAWLRMLLDDGRFGGREVIRASTLREIFSPHTIMAVAPDTLLPSTHFGAYGLGIAMRDYKGVKLLQHTGGIDGMLSLVAFVPERDLGIVVLTNTDGHNNVFTALMLRVLDAYLGGPERDWSGIFLERQIEAERRAVQAAARLDSARVAGTTPSLRLADYAGTYRSDLFGDATVTHENGQLSIRLGPFDGPLEHWHYDTFRTGAGGLGGAPALVTFGLDARGRAATLTVDLQGAQTFTRTDDDAASR